MLRDVKRWREAAEVLAEAAGRFKDDVDLIYEQAMVEEKLNRFAEMERLLRRVIELKPEHPHAHNALGYSLVDRLYRFSPDGDRLWTSDDTQVSAGALQFIFAGSDGAVLTAGTVTLTKPDGS